MSAGTPRSLASSGQKPIQDICHPLSAEESALSRSPDVLHPGSAGERDLILPNGTPVDTSSPASSSSLLNRECTKTTRTEFDLPEYSVRRRYQDFDWLRNKLEESQPTHLIPPLPEKFVMKGVLSFNEHFNAFLSAKDLNKRQGLALLTKMGESVKYVTGGYKVRARPVEFAAMGDYLDLFTQKLGTIDRIAQRIIKEQSEFLMELREYGPVFSSWSSFEEDLHDPLEGVSGCVSNCSSALEELTEDMSEDFLPVLREYVLYIESMKNVLKKRDQVQAEYETKLEAVVFREDKKTPVSSDVEKCQDRVECFNADLKADWERWENNKRQDFRQLLMGMSDKNIQYYEKCLAAWESLIPLLQDKQEAKGETN
ncbi:LOW QUALITY PROTEIN: sorting nexin-30 [Sinocyclocheilus anshuiensis]|uniref:LOW QUALITY PROTEIN: sorting nexin-30 n=1 Tax=Sinocyclocheilus anshuiensis TaxID=1608454 RepID=UPI003D68092E